MSYPWLLVAMALMLAALILFALWWTHRAVVAVGYSLLGFSMIIGSLGVGMLLKFAIGLTGPIMAIALFFCSMGLIIAVISVGVQAVVRGGAPNGEGRI